MTPTASGRGARRRSVNLSIRADVIEAAKALDLNASQAAETGILHAIRKAQGERWLEENRDALAAHNARIGKTGPLLTPDWATEE